MLRSFSSGHYIARVAAALPLVVDAEATRHLAHNSESPTPLDDRSRTNERWTERMQNQDGITAVTNTVSRILHRPRGRTITIALGILLCIVCAGSVVAQDATVLDTTIAPGGNYDRAAFRLWYPNNVGPLKAVVVLVPGSNGDGRLMVEDTVWQAFARQHHVALLGSYFTDRAHDLELVPDFIEEYADASRGSGQALLDALAALAERARHPELANAGLLLWGMSAGGEFNYEFTAWRPDRVIAFVVNKGGIYYHSLVPAAARRVPGLFFVGELDMAFRTNTIVGLYAVNRRAGALWALTEEPGVAHVEGRSRDIALVFFDDMLALRLDESGKTFGNSGGATALRPLDPQSGFIGDLAARVFKPARDLDAPTEPTAWLPTRRVAEYWQAIVAGKSFEP